VLTSRVRSFVGAESFLERNFRFGDPADYFHPPGHPHHSKPDFSGLCEQCVPPVHGKVSAAVISGPTHMASTFTGSAYRQH
jgi:hypothetical protein